MRVRRRARGATPLALVLAVGLLSSGATQCLIDFPSQIQIATPVLFVHGLGGEGANSFAEARAWLWDNGYEGRELREMNLSNSWGCIEGSAKEVALAAAQLVADTGADKIDMVGHSLGGLAGRYFIKNLGGAEVVRTFVSITSPQHGTLGAQPSPLVPCAINEMAIGSPFLNALNAVDETPGGVNYVTIRGLNDILVIPNTSPLLKGARNLDLNLGTALDHYFVLYTEEGFRLIQDALAPPIR